MLEDDPVGPGGVERLAEDVLELARIKGLRVFRAAQPVHGLVDPVGQREIGKETRSVEVGVGADLKVDLSALAFEAERREQLEMVVHLGAEDYFIIAALRAPEA